ncbi:VirB8 family type IV secretion system protein [Candidatus Trichorickettsia mobilis]|uniref:virB8 family protein n=1 Tax=Candidatus Trichorickettsia mobilis TaxID=1346319 RepID=UPI00292F6ADA|nr:VirB8/TrbF family protein [Candidatus Trichorickettsia mobilis]
MLNLTGLLHKFKSTAAATQDSQQSNVVRSVRNWYEERYDSIIVQRNILFMLLLIFVILSIISIISVAVVINSKRFDPFVIQIDETTGMAKIVNPTSSQMLEGNDSLARYFIKKYVIARETYNPVDFDTQAKQIVRLFSSSSTFFTYLGYLKNQDVNPGVIYGQKNTTYLTVKSWSKLDAKKYMLRFSISETSENKRVFNKLAIIDFNYVAMDLTETERDINPIGFQVQGYRVDDDNS